LLEIALQAGLCADVVGFCQARAGGTLTVTLPDYTTLATGWTMGFQVEASRAITINVNNGHITTPKGSGGAPLTSISMPALNKEYVLLHHDGSGNFRLISVTPKTAGALALYDHIEFNGSTPTTSNCGTGASVAGNDNGSGRVAEKAVQR
jgi:hypothetical protein